MRGDSGNLQTDRFPIYLYDLYDILGFSFMMSKRIPSQHDQLALHH